MPDAKAEDAFKRIVRRYLDQVEYVRSISDESPFFPQHIHVEPTNACNLRCIHCHHHELASGRQAITRPFGVMDMGVYRNVIDEIASMKCAITLNVQGEPMLHPQFTEMVACAKSLGLFTSVLTNATKLTDALAQTLIDLKLDRIVFSFDGVDKEMYEGIRVKSQFEPTLRNVLSFIRLNHEQGHPTHVCASIIRQERTAGHLEDYKRYFNRLPVDRIFVSNLLTLSGGSGVSDEIDVGGLQQGSREAWPICRVPWENLTVNWDGEITACPLDYNVVYSIGNVKNASLREIWNGRRMRQFRQAHLKRDYRLVEENGPLCESCNCMWDPEYDLRNFRDFAVEAIYRQAVHFAHQFSEQPILDDDQKYKNLLIELEKVSESLNQRDGSRGSQNAEPAFRPLSTSVGDVF
jgi:radical SAM protein with 4Fe4S-binding SPASM domain